MSNGKPAKVEPLRSGCLSKVGFGCGGALAIVAILLLLTPPGMFVALPVLVVAGFFHWWGRRLSAPTVEQALARDPRPAVLYLRSFELDRRVTTGLMDDCSRMLPDATRPIYLPIARVADGFRRLVGQEAIERFSGDTVEAELVKVFAQIGPLIAVGRPGEIAPLPGVARLYLGDDWQERVSQELRAAALVLIQPWFSGFVRWEIKAALRETDPRRVLLLFWRVTDVDYEKFRAFAEEEGLRLPPASARQNGDDFVRFDSAGTARFVSVSERSGIGRVFLERKDLITMAAALKQELESLPPPKARAR